MALFHFIYIPAYNYNVVFSCFVHSQGFAPLVRNVYMTDCKYCNYVGVPECLIDVCSPLYPASLLSFTTNVSYHTTVLYYFLILRGESGGAFSASTVDTPHSVVPNLASGTIDKTLYEAAIDAGIDTNHIVKLADILGWDVDFTTEDTRG